MIKRVVGLVLLLAVVCVARVAYHIYVPVSNTQTSTIIDIPKGSSVRDISSLLYKKGLTRTSAVFYHYVRYKKQGHLLKAGAFKISPHLNLKKTLHLFID